ncbi:MAG: nucleotidyl transferase AbiEii/AbiGii toxin family protein, partial [Clostridia bacterium]|nr:nucleotidyl transferase AbiEii/AbiGii toxin family protein [Clostridia bacterium]
MINTVFLEQVKKYPHDNINEIKNALKETLQDIILAGLAKGDFFKVAAFYGGTSLRIFRGLPRFSEDLDFTLINNEVDFDLNRYLPFIHKEFISMDIYCSIKEKQKNVLSTVETRFVDFSLVDLLGISFPEYMSKVNKDEFLSIKIEVEKHVFDGGEIERLLLTYPSFSSITTYKMETLFASKIIAILNRKWKNRVKGRDFYDYLFYISKSTKVNMTFLENGLRAFGYELDDGKLTIDLLRGLLVEKFSNVDYDA